MALKRFDLFDRIGADPNDDEDVRLQKASLVRVIFLFIPAGLLWGVFYFILGEPKAGLIPFLYGLFSFASVVIFAIKQNLKFFKISQLLLILLLPFFLMLSLRGFVNSSAVIIWSIICPLGALVFANQRQAPYWFAAFIFLVVISGFLQAPGEISVDLAPQTIIFFFVANIVAVSILVFWMLYYFLAELQREKEKSNQLLLNVLPTMLVPKLKNPAEQTIAEQYDDVSVLFADIVGFTKLSVEFNPHEMVEHLNTVFSFFDTLVEKYSVEKIRTIGDNYMVVSGAPVRYIDHAQRLARMALEMLAYLDSPANSTRGHLQFRIGINSGPVIAGVIGKTKFHYDVWGDTVNTASRMESHGVPGKIQITAATSNLLEKEFICTFRGAIDVKGKGLIATWFLDGVRFS